MSINEKPFKAQVNGEPVELRINPGETLLEVLRERLDLTGSKEGCGEGVCGACTVIVDGTARRACLTLALEAEGCEVLTVEGLAPGQKVSPLQKAFVLEGAIQCGFCTPGMLMASHDLLQREPNPDTGAIKNQLSGHICRCTGYAKIIEAVKAVADVPSTEDCQ
jgi:aerobic-type carbon monoxide dehydrogenase small subunit (CoxS/CutS family)